MFLIWIQGTKILCARGWVRRCCCVSPGMEWFSLDLPQGIKKGSALEVGCRGVWNSGRGQKKSWGKQWEILIVAIGESYFCRLLTTESRSVTGVSQSMNQSINQNKDISLKNIVIVITVSLWIFNYIIVIECHINLQSYRIYRIYVHLYSSIIQSHNHI